MLLFIGRRSLARRFLCPKAVPVRELLLHVLSSSRGIYVSYVHKMVLYVPRGGPSVTLHYLVRRGARIRDSSIRETGP